MKRLVFVTQAYDPASTILGVTRDWVAALAARCAGVDVIATAAPAGLESPPNVRVTSLGKERGASRAAQALNLVQALAATVPRAGAVFVHMVPRLAVIAFPFAATARRPLALWYAQGGVDRFLRLAARLADQIMTPTRDSFPLAGAEITRRIAVTGHGIDTRRYAPHTASSPDASDEPGGPALAGTRRLLAVGRLSPSKRYDLLLDALSRLPDRAWRLRIAGPPLYPSDLAHADALRRQAISLGIGERVQFAGAVPYAAMPGEYRGAWLLAHTSATGSLDKVVLEALACGTPVISTAPSSRTALGAISDLLSCPDDHPDAIAGALGVSLHWTAERRAALGAAGRAVVEREHSLDGWAGHVVHLLGVG